MIFLIIMIELPNCIRAFREPAKTISQVHHHDRTQAVLNSAKDRGGVRTAVKRPISELRRFARPYIAVIKLHYWVSLSRCATSKHSAWSKFQP